MNKIIEEIEELKNIVFDKVRDNDLDFKECSTDGDSFTCIVKDHSGHIVEIAISVYDTDKVNSNGIR